MLFSAVEDLMKSGRVRRDQIVFEYYGSRRTAAYLNSLIEQMDMPPYFYDCGSVRKMELLSAQRRAQLLVLPAWDWRAERGEVPVGLYEALALQKPVLALLFGDVAGGEFSRIMRSLRIGYCFEEEVGRDSYEGMKKYIAECLTYWRTRSRDLYEPDEKRYRSLDFEVLARQWAEIIND